MDQTKVTASDRIGDYTKKDAAAVVAAYRALDHDGNGQLDINKCVCLSGKAAPRAFHTCPHRPSDLRPGSS